MYRVTSKEVTEKFDAEGNLTERVTRTETTEDDNAMESISTDPYTIVPTWGSDSTSSAGAPCTSGGTVVAKSAVAEKSGLKVR